MNRYSKDPRPVIPNPVPASPIAHRVAPRNLPHGLDRKVSPETAAQLIADHESGTPSTQLTRIYGFGKGSVLKLLRDAGVQMCNQGLSSDNLEEAATLYQEGFSLSGVTEKSGCSIRSVRKQFKIHSMQIRLPTGWPDLHAMRKRFGSRPIYPSRLG